MSETGTDHRVIRPGQDGTYIVEGRRFEGEYGTFEGAVFAAEKLIAKGEYKHGIIK